MDKPAKWFGSSHRQYLHDPLTIAYIWAMKGQKAAQHAILHIVADQIISSADKVAKKAIRTGVEGFLKELANFRNQK